MFDFRKYFCCGYESITEEGSDYLYLPRRPLQEESPEKPLLIPFSLEKSSILRSSLTEEPFNEAFSNIRMEEEVTRAAIRLQRFMRHRISHIKHMKKLQKEETHLIHQIRREKLWEVAHTTALDVVNTSLYRVILETTAARAIQRSSSLIIYL